MEEEIMNLIRDGYTIVFSPSLDKDLIDVSILLGEKLVAWDYGLLPEALTDAYVQVPEIKETP